MCIEWFGSQCTHMKMKNQIVHIQVIIVVFALCVSYNFIAGIIKPKTSIIFVQSSLDDAAMFR